jgi:small subunit ribosomal protein S12
MPTISELVTLPRVNVIEKPKSPALRDNPFGRGMCAGYDTYTQKARSALRQVAKLRLTTGIEVIADIPDAGRVELQFLFCVQSFSGDAGAL